MNEDLPNDFKLIAIRPLVGCNSKYLKIIKEDKLYQFYHNYIFNEEIDTNNNVPSITVSDLIPQNLFWIERTNNTSLPISISAIVGKNGSGKSALIELFFAVVYNLAVEKGILKYNESGESLQLVENIKVQIYYSIGDCIFCLESNSGDKFFNKENDKKSLLFRLIEYSDKSTMRNFKINKVIENDQSLLLSSFFYTIAINYSIYGLNSRYLDTWIDSLFHKNDGYQTPVVINPMRTRGDIDTNNESDLVKQRLVANILEPIISMDRINDSLRNLAPGKNALKLILNFNSKKFEEDIAEVENSRVKNFNECISLLFSKYTGRSINIVPPDPELRKTEQYVLKKLIRICENYERYYEFFSDSSFINIDTFTDRLIDDKSHITFKLKQAINFIRHQHIPNVHYNKQFEVDIEKLSNIIAEIKEEEYKEGRILSTIELIPPSVFNIKIVFDETKDFDDLSSGEKQKIYGLSSIVYHLINLNSVFNNGSNENITNELYKYNFVNILFDEVELYFHPEYQRRFIDDLLSFIKKVSYENLKNICAINMCFATHSPFILSDIPNTNVLLLNEGNPIKPNLSEQTFGANIHDLLANDFFLNGGTIGEFSKRKIQLVIDKLNAWREKKLTDKDKFNWKDIVSSEKENVFRLITLVGDPIVRDKLFEMYWDIFGYDSVSDREIHFLNTLLDTIKKQKQ